MNAISVSTIAGEELIIPAYNIRLIRKNPSGRATIELRDKTLIESKDMFQQLRSEIRSLTAYTVDEGC